MDGISRGSELMINKLFDIEPNFKEFFNNSKETFTDIYQLDQALNMKLCINTMHGEIKLNSDFGLFSMYCEFVRVIIDCSVKKKKSYVINLSSELVIRLENRDHNIVQVSWGEIARPYMGEALTMRPRALEENILNVMNCLDENLSKIIEHHNIDRYIYPFSIFNICY
jgi:hypothetical protein